MPSIAVSNVPDAVHCASPVRGAQHGRSAEAEIRGILEQTVKPEGRIKLGSFLAAIEYQVKLTDGDFFHL